MRCEIPRCDITLLGEKTSQSGFGTFVSGRKIEKWLCAGKVRQEEGQTGRESGSVDEGNKKSDACVCTCVCVEL